MNTKKRVTAAVVASLSMLSVLAFSKLSGGKAIQDTSLQVTGLAAESVTAESVIAENVVYSSKGLSNGIIPAQSLVAVVNYDSQGNMTGDQQDAGTENEIVLDEQYDELQDVLTNSLDDVVITTMSMSDNHISFDKILPKVSEFLNIRKEADPESEVVGKLYKNSYADILDRKEEWTKIKSGSVTGYVNNDYVYFDDDAVAVAKSLDAFQVKVTGGTVNIRQKPTTDSEILDKAKKGDTYTHVPEMDHDEWIAILYDEKGTLAYVNQEYAKEQLNLKTAVSKEQEEKAKKEAELAKALQEAKKHQPEKTNRKAIKASDDEIFLLATVVAMEAGGESYEGQLAVANVVINRMLDGYWGKSIHDVVYAPGQFSGANSGRIEKYASRVTESNKRAAIEALAGNNNIGNYMYFLMKSRANYSSYKKYYILGCHCFYSR